MKRTIRPSVTRLLAQLRRADGIRDLLSLPTTGVAHLLLRRGPLAGSGAVRGEAPVLITGMHRSGTSIATRLLERAGMYVGGSWLERNHESIHFARANKAMIGEGPYKLHDYGWAAPKTDAFIQERRGYAERAADRVSLFFAGREGEQVWGWKDPRTCLTLPVWLSIYPEAKVLHIVRDGRAVALSMTERDGLAPSFGLALWAHYVTRLERALEAVPAERKLTVRFETLMEAPASTLREMCDFAGLAPPESIETMVSDIDPSRAAAPLSDPRLDGIGDHALLARYGYAPRAETGDEPPAP